MYKHAKAKAQPCWTILVRNFCTNFFAKRFSRASRVEQSKATLLAVFARQMKTIFSAFLPVLGPCPSLKMSRRGRW